MKENEDIFEKAIEALKNEQIPPGPPEELAAATAAKLGNTAEQAETAETKEPIRLVERLRATGNFAKVAAAAVLLILAGYAAGRLSGPQPPDAEQLRAAIEPAIRQNLLDEVNRNMLSGLANGYIQLKDELSQQYRQDLNRVAIQTLAASNTVTNQLLAELIESINDAQLQDRRWVEAALKQIVSNQLRDKTQLSNAFATFAVQTEDELIRTKNDVAYALSYALPESSVPFKFENSENPDERSKK
ncbi:MAG: hypothetical protein ABIF19_12715 [Planctomycetota bacterium]